MLPNTGTAAPTTEIRMGSGLAAPHQAVLTDAPPAAPATRPSGRRLALAAAALLSPIGLAVQYATNSAGLPRQDADVYLGAVAADTGGMLVSTIAYTAAMTAMIAVGALAAVTLRRTAPIASAVAAALLAVGAVGGGAFAGLRLAALALVEDGEVVPGGAETFVRLQAAIIDPVGLLLVCAIVGTIALAVAMHRSRRVIGWWPAAVTVLGFVLSSGEFPNAVSVAGALAQGAALVPLVRLARATD